MELKSCSTPKDVREALRALPKTLKETYDKILDSVPERNQRYIRAALKWIACSARPLSLDELAVAAVIDPAVATPNGFENQLFRGGETIHKMLSKLIDVHKVERVSLMDFLNPPGASIPDLLHDIERRRDNLKIPGSTIVKFSHSSVRDYLLQRHDDADISRSFSFSENMAHRFIAKSSWAYFQSIPDTASVGHKACDASWLHLLGYLVRHWHTHAVRLPDEEPGSLVHLINVPLAVTTLLMAEDEYTDLSFDDIVGWESSQMKPPSPEQMLQYAACSGFSCVADSILASNPDLDVNASAELGTALLFACERRHWQVADTLLKRGADPNKGTELDYPLVHASMHGADDILQELISHRADVNIQSESDYEDTPLIAAIVACHPSTIELLLVNGADPDVVSSLGIPLAVAARKGRHECMEILLKHRASLNVKVLDADSPSLLEEASASGSVETVNLLLTQGLDVNEKDCLEPLHVARILPASTYSFSYPNITLAFSDSISTITVQSYGSPMHAAAAYGHTEVIKLLVENDAAVNERSPYWETPSTLAKLRGHKEALEYLLSKGGEALEQTEVCYRQDRFRVSGVSENYGVYDHDEDNDSEGHDVLSDANDAMEH